jgi:hypothetical protein
MQEAGGVRSVLETLEELPLSSSFSYTGRKARIKRVSSTAFTKQRKLKGSTTSPMPCIIEINVGLVPHSTVELFKPMSSKLDLGNMTIAKYLLRQGIFKNLHG